MYKIYKLTKLKPDSDDYGLQDGILITFYEPTDKLHMNDLVQAIYDLDMKEPYGQLFGS